MNSTTFIVQSLKCPDARYAFKNNCNCEYCGKRSACHASTILQSGVDPETRSDRPNAAATTTSTASTTPVLRTSRARWGRAERVRLPTPAVGAMQVDKQRQALDPVRKGADGEVGERCVPSIEECGANSKAQANGFCITGAIVDEWVDIGIVGSIVSPASTGRSR